MIYNDKQFKLSKFDYYLIRKNTDDTLQQELRIVISNKARAMNVVKVCQHIRCQLKVRWFYGELPSYHFSVPLNILSHIVKIMVHFYFIKLRLFKIVSRDLNEFSVS